MICIAILIVLGKSLEEDLTASNMYRRSNLIKIKTWALGRIHTIHKKVVEL